MNEKLKNKLGSGRFLFTIACAIVFTTLSINKTLPNDKVMEVILVIVTFYFTKVKNEPKPPEPKV